MESTASPQKVVTDLPKLPAIYAWHVIEAHHANGTTFWLRLTDSLWQEIAQFGWRTGYVPTSQQLIHRAEIMMREHGIETTAMEAGQHHGE